MLTFAQGRLPALGWNSWNAYGCDVNETKILDAANYVVSLGLKDVGYEYVNSKSAPTTRAFSRSQNTVDDCWEASARDPTTGQIIPNPVTFPNGISGVADSVHDLGLKLGLYGSAGTETCAGYPAEIDQEMLDATLFASWGIDYWKYDNCNVPANWTDQYVYCVPDQDGTLANGTCPVTSSTAPPGYNWATSNTTKRYNRMRDALLAQNRTILYSLCCWGDADVVSWGNGTANSWRMSGDIQSNWPRIAEILNENSFLLNHVNFWGHNDPDMLEIGNGDLTLEENRSHFAFWAAMKGPLIIGTDLSVLSSDYLSILKNKYLLAFSQDEVFGPPAMPYKWGVNPDWTFNATNPAEYWSGESTQGTLVLALNTLDETADREILWSEVPSLKNSGNSFQVTDIWSGRNLGCVSGGIKQPVASHDTIGYLVGEKCWSW